jgi:predicted nucleic acid-binding protein
MDELETTAKAKLAAYLTKNADASDADRLALNVFRAFPLSVFAPSKATKIANAAFDVEMTETQMETALERLRRARVLRFHNVRNAMERYYEVAL